VAPPTRTSIEPPRLASLPAARAQLEYSSRSIVFARDGARLLRAWGTPERPWVLAVEPRGTRWGVEAWGADARTARTAARALFSLDHPIEAFYRLVRREPVLAGTERRFRGLRLPRDASVYESLLHAVIGQQLSVRAALSMQRRLFDRTGSVLTAGRVEVPSVPPPRAIQALGEPGLRSTGLSGAKARTILALASAATRPLLDDPALAHAPPEVAVERLDALPGVGRWTAENALLRGTGRTDLFVAGDLGIRVALAEYGVLPRSAREEAARAWAERWYPGWGSYATLYLWRRLVSDRAAAAG
jgi:3-methyladenine DNA glycosylase/8-oxoguanine DNA glycosylase